MTLLTMHLMRILIGSLLALGIYVVYINDLVIFHHRFHTLSFSIVE